jgi:hypothetical protein
MTLYRIDDMAAPLGESGLDLERTDATLNAGVGSLAVSVSLPPADFDRLFFARYGIGYVAAYFRAKKLELRVATHPRRTNTCFEKAELLGAWDPLNVIKCLYFEHALDGSLYAIVTPETGCFVDRARIAGLLRVEAAALRKATSLPRNMEPGTCSPFVVKEDLRAEGGKLVKIVFDTETLVTKKHDSTLDDFSFGLDHRMSVQLNYYHCFKMLKALYPETVVDEELLTLSFKEVLVRSRGRLKITYEFNSLSYRIAKFINGIHGHGDVSIINDHVDELDLPDVLTVPKSETGLVHSPES